MRHYVERVTRFFILAAIVLLPISVVGAQDATPQVGGTFVIGVDHEINTLDAHMMNIRYEFAIASLVGAGLLYTDADGNYEPYLATAFEVSDDGLEYVFYLRDGVTFHNGDPLTAHDFVYTYQRAIAPETASVAAGSALAQMESIEAVDDYTLKITLSAPSYYFLANVANSKGDGVLQPLSQRAIEEAGDQYGNNPVGVGPYRFVEWIIGDRVILERNPDFAWHAPSMDQNGPYLETIVYRILLENSTRVAGIQTGEIDFAFIGVNDVATVESTGTHDVIDIPFQGAFPFVNLNIHDGPTADVKVRQALAYAINREAMIQAVVQGNGNVQYGPISNTVAGYWPGVEEIGYGYDPELSGSLLEEAGYALNDDGHYERDGEVLKITLLASTIQQQPMVGEVLADMWSDVGIEVEIELVEVNQMWTAMGSGEFEAAVGGYGWPTAEVLFLAFHSATSGLLGGPEDELDTMLMATLSALTKEEFEEATQKVQERIVSQAYGFALFNSPVNTALTQRVEGAFVRPSQALDILGAYVVDN